MNHSSANDVLSRNPFSNYLVTTSPNAPAMVASLSMAFSGKFNFTISTRKLDRQNSPELTTIKEKVKAIPQIEFQTVSEIKKHLQNYILKFKNYRRNLFQNRASMENETEVEQAEELRKILDWVNEEYDSFGTGGGQPITCHSKLINESSLRAQQEADKVQLKIRGIHILRDKTEYWQGFWDAIQDSLLPDAAIAAGTPAEPVVALVLWAAGLIVSGIVYDRSWEREKFLEVLDTWEEMLMEDYKLILETKEEMLKYQSFVDKAEGLWISEVEAIWVTKFNKHPRGNSTLGYGIYLQTIAITERKLLLTIRPFEQALDQIYPFYGPGISVQRNTKNFCDDVPDALIHLRKLLTAKAIIHNSQQEQFQEKVYSLAQIIYGRLEQTEKLCAQWSKSIDPGELAVFLEEAAEDFLLDTGRVIQEIKHILKTGIRDRKKDKALKKRTELDRHLKSWDWKDRPLVTPAGAMEVLEDLEAIIRVIYRVSLSTGTGTIMPSMEGMIIAQRSYVEFNHSNSLLEQFFKVLREEIQRGSIAFPESRETETTGTKTSRGWRRWIGWRKKPEAPISGL